MKIVISIEIRKYLNEMLMQCLTYAVVSCSPNVQSHLQDCDFARGQSQVKCLVAKFTNSNLLLIHVELTIRLGR